ncbi:MAG: YjgP/YjgQ family permease, partial [Lentisphaerae bacterium]|nr:YjgP/YjgQ family permease [Lentisphaerota bacterium]
MKTLDRHVCSALLVAFAGSVVITTFVISLTGIFELVELLARGAPWQAMFQLLLWGIPAALTFSVPLSALTASLLVFGKLSSDGEVMAMKASGISMWRIMRVPLLISGVLTMLCLTIHSEVAPRSHRAMGEVIAGLGVLSPSETLDAGRFIDDFEGLTIYLGRKKGNRVYNVRVYDVRNPGLKREIVAKSGRIAADENGRDLWIDLYDVRIAPFSD